MKMKLKTALEPQMNADERRQRSEARSRKSEVRPPTPDLRPSRSTEGYAMLMVLVIVASMMVVMGGTIYRTYTVAKLNDRNMQSGLGQNAAEAATEKVYAKLAFDFQNGGLGNVLTNLGIYRGLYPTASENAYWGRFEFSDAQGNANKTYVSFLTNYSGNLPSQYPGLFTLSSPVYRIVSNTRLVNGTYALTNAAQDDILLAMIPITTYAIFYNSLLEFSTAATMTVNGRVHANGKIYTGTSATLTFNDTVTTTATLTSPANNGQGPWPFPGAIFNGSPKFKTNVPTVNISINMTNTHSLIEIPPVNNASTIQGQQQLYNLAQVVLLVSNTSVTVKLQASPGLGQVPGADTAPTYTTLTNLTPSYVSSNLPFLSLTNAFVDQRENSKAAITTQIDVEKYAQWLTTNLLISGPGGKLPVTSGSYPTILFVADNRTNSPTQLTVVRVVNGAAPPSNGGLGFTVATPNPLYVWGNYNNTNPLFNETTNTSASVPCAFISDAVTFLSPAWQDSLSSSPYSARDPENMTVNAALITGIMPSTGTSSATFSGGVHNLPRLLEDWSGHKLWLNTSIVNLFNSTRATNKFITPGPGSYYSAPTRRFSFDLNFMDPARQPPGVPTALVPIRFNWAVPPPNTVTYNVVP